MAKKTVPGEKDVMAIVVEDMRSQFRAFGEALEAVETRLTNESRRTREEIGTRQDLLELAIRDNTARISALEGGVQGLKTDVAELKTDVAEIKGHLVVVDSRLDGLETSVRENTAVTRTLVEKVDSLANHEPRIAALERRVG